MMMLHRLSLNQPSSHLANRNEAVAVTAPTVALPSGLSVAATHWVEELGLAQAIWVLEVEKFGPFLVESDLTGASLFERENAKIAPGIEKLYEGTKPAAMRRYGETDDKTEEII